MRTYLEKQADGEWVPVEATERWPEPADYPWHLLSEDDLAYLAQPAVRRCVWCKRVPPDHHPACKEQLEQWHTMPWGKHKKKRITDVPDGYLEFVVQNWFGNQDDRTMFVVELQRRDPVKYRGWEMYMEAHEQNEERQYVGWSQG